MLKLRIIHQSTEKIFFLTGASFSKGSTIKRVKNGVEFVIKDRKWKYLFNLKPTIFRNSFFFKLLRQICFRKELLKAEAITIKNDRYVYCWLNSPEPDKVRFVFVNVDADGRTLSFNCISPKNLIGGVYLPFQHNAVELVIGVRLEGRGRLETIEIGMHQKQQVGLSPEQFETLFAEQKFYHILSILEDDTVPESISQRIKTWSALKMHNKILKAYEKQPMDFNSEKKLTALVFAATATKSSLVVEEVVQILKAGKFSHETAIAVHKKISELTEKSEEQIEVDVDKDRAWRQDHYENEFA